MDSRIVGRSDGIEKVRRTIADIADTGVDVLIEGETGTGKELVARCLHDFSNRRGKRFVRSELRRPARNHHRKRAVRSRGRGVHRRGETAHRQARIRPRRDRVSRRDRVDAAWAFKSSCCGSCRNAPSNGSAATSRFRSMSASSRRRSWTWWPRPRPGVFAKILYYRLNVARVAIPPLRERASDVPLLFHHFLGKACRRFNREIPQGVAKPTWRT